MKELIEKLNTEFEAFKADAELQLEKSNKAAVPERVNHRLTLKSF